MSTERRSNERIEFDTSIKLMIMDPYSKIVKLEDVSIDGIKITSDLDLELFSEYKFINIEMENSIPFKAKVVWKSTLENGLFAYGMVMVNELSFNQD